MIRANNEEVACEPLKAEGQQITSSIASLASRGDNLKPLKVVFQSGCVGANVGDEVFLRPDAYGAAFMGHVYQAQGVKFILVPKSMVILVNNKSY